MEILFLYDLILTFLCTAVGEKLPHLIFIKSQNFYKRLDGRLHGILILIDLQTVKDHIIDLVAGCLGYFRSGHRYLLFLPGVSDFHISAEPGSAPAFDICFRWWH